MPFLSRNFPFWYTPTDISGFKNSKSEQQKKKKKDSPLLILIFLPLPSVIFYLPFSLFSLFSLPLFIFPVGQQKLPGEKVRGILPPVCLHHWVYSINMHIKNAHSGITKSLSQRPILESVLVGLVLKCQFYCLFFYTKFIVTCFMFLNLKSVHLTDKVYHLG